MTFSLLLKKVLNTAGTLLQCVLILSGEQFGERSGATDASSCSSPVGGQPASCLARLRGKQAELHCCSEFTATRERCQVQTGESLKPDPYAVVCKSVGRFNYIFVLWSGEDALKILHCYFAFIWNCKKLWRAKVSNFLTCWGVMQLMQTLLGFDCAVKCFLSRYISNQITY